jgi:benzoate 4-monooxygenase
LYDSLTNTLYYIISDKSCLLKLRQEVESRLNLSDPEEMVPYNLVRDLPYLRACIDESLRLRPPIAYPLQRVVTAPEGATVLGYHLRQGTVVAVPPYSAHRIASVFPEPERYSPERWLNKDDPKQIYALKNCTIPFSVGPRACIGRHIAIVELQILISSIVRRYDVKLVHPQQKLEVFERFQSNPGPLPVRLRRRQVSVQ